VNDLELEADGEDTGVDELKPLNAVLEIQRAHDPVVLKSRALAAAQHARVESVDAQDRPRLYASASVSGRAGGAPASNGVVPTGNGLLPTVPNWHVGVVFAWPVYDPVTYKRQKAAQLLGRALDVEAEEVQRTQRAQVTALYEQARLAAASLAALGRGAQAAQANYALAEQRFSLGLGSSIELSDAEMLLIEAEVQLAVGKSEVLNKRAKLARAIGGEP
jgi:outer membrane protein